MSDEVLRAIEELKAEQRKIASRQEEALEMLKAEAEHARRIREESIALQRAATQRVKRVGVFAFFGIVVCVVLIVYLVTKYRILF